MRHLLPRAVTALLVAAVLALAARPARAQEYVGSDRCQTCHRAEHNRFAQTAKGRLLLENPRNDIERRGCEACHGPGSGHVDARGHGGGPGFITFARDDSTPVATRNAVCLQCHAGGARMLWAGSQHDAANLACTDCHSIMSPQSEAGFLRQQTPTETCGRCHARQERAVMQSRSRMPLHEERMACPSCHNPHGSATEKLLAQTSVNEVCFQCHADKRGPYLWQHAPVVENCANCHDPHGGRNEMMLVRPKPRLCQACHDETGHPARPMQISNPPQVYLTGRECTNCHFAIHGSNHSGGQRFVR